MDTTQKNRDPKGQKDPQTRGPESRPQQPERSRRPQSQEKGQRPRRPESQPASRPAREPREGAAPRQRPAPEGREAPRPQKQIRSGAVATRPRPSQKKKSGGLKLLGRGKGKSPRELDDTLSSKRRAYGNSKPKEPSKLKTAGAGLNRLFQRTKAKAQTRKESKASSRPAPPAVIYTEPKAFNRRRFIVQLLTVICIVMAMVLGLSVFFKVETITVSGAQVYSPWAVREASGISEGDSLLSFGNVRAGALIKANLPYVNNVRIGIKLPDTVNIIVEEEEVVYAIKSQEGLWWLMTSDGRVVEQTNGGKAVDYTQILGVTLLEPIAGEKAIATEISPVQEETQAAPQDPTAETKPLVTGAGKLNAALEIVKALEANGIVGDAASVDVSNLEKIALWYGTRYEVNLGDSSKLTYKVDCMNDAILQLSDYQSGRLDVSFTIWPDKVIYTPFA